MLQMIRTFSSFNIHTYKPRLTIKEVDDKMSYAAILFKKWEEMKVWRKR